MLRMVVGSMSDLAAHILERMQFECIDGGLPRASVIPKTRSTHEAYAAGYNRACEEIAELLTQVSVESPTDSQTIN